MEKHLQRPTISHTDTPDADPVTSMQQLHMEKEFANELAVMKAAKLEPRKEAVDQLLRMIAQKSIAEQH